MAFAILLNFYWLSINRRDFSCFSLLFKLNLFLLVLVIHDEGLLLDFSFEFVEFAVDFGLTVKVDEVDEGDLSEESP